MATLSRDINKAEYAGLDFNTHIDDMLAELQVKFGADFNDFVLSSTAIVLIDVMAFGLDTLSFYLDRRASDQYLLTARTPKAITRITRQLGYKLRGAFPHSVDVDISINPPDNLVLADIPIPEGTLFQGPNGIIYQAASGIIFSPPHDPTEVQVLTLFQGEAVTETFSSTGAANQVFRLAKTPQGQFVSNASVRVFVNSVEWPEEDFLTKDATNQFEVAYRDVPATVRFGDGTSGNIPPPGYSIEVRYVATRGLAGYVSEGSITRLVSPLVPGPVPITITNPNPSSGGDNYESLSQAQAQAPLVYKTRKVAITRSDYEGLANNFASPIFGRVAVAQAVSARSAESDITLTNLINSITIAAGTASPAIDAAVSASLADLDTIDVASASISADLADISASTTLINTNLTGALAAISTINTTVSGPLKIISDSSSNVASANQTVLSSFSALGSSIALITDIGPNTLDAPTRNAILNAINAGLGGQALVTSNNSGITGQIGILNNNLNSVRSNVDVIKTEVTKIGTDITSPNSYLLSLESNRANIDTASADIRNVQLVAITDSNIITVDSIAAFLNAIQQHVGCLLSSDCAANLVVVPVLTLDSGGFYSPPSNGLIIALQTYLDSLKEVTQTVSVTSGEGALVRACITVKASVFPNIDVNVKTNEIRAAVEATVRNRSFGVSLYESDINENVRNVRDLSNWTISVDGYYDPVAGVLKTDKLDPVSGRRGLLIAKSEVITRASIRSSVGAPGVIVEVTVIETQSATSC